MSIGCKTIQGQRAVIGVDTVVCVYGVYVGTITGYRVIGSIGYYDVYIPSISVTMQVKPDDIKIGSC